MSEGYDLLWRLHHLECETLCEGALHFLLKLLLDFLLKLLLDLCMRLCNWCFLLLDRNHELFIHRLLLLIDNKNNDIFLEEVKRLKILLKELLYKLFLISTLEKLYRHVFIDFISVLTYIEMISCTRLILIILWIFKDNLLLSKLCQILDCMILRIDEELDYNIC